MPALFSESVKAAREDMKRTAFRCNYPRQDDKSPEGMLCRHTISKLEDARDNLITHPDPKTVKTCIYKYSVELTNVALRYLYCSRYVDSPRCYTTFPDLSSATSLSHSKIALVFVNAWFIIPNKNAEPIPNKWLRLQHKDISKRFQTAPGDRPPPDSFMKRLQDEIVKKHSSQPTVFNFIGYLNIMFEKILSLFNPWIVASPATISWSTRIDLPAILTSPGKRQKMANLCRYVNKIYNSLASLYYGVHCDSKMLPLCQAPGKVQKRPHRQSNSPGKRFAKHNDGKCTTKYVGSTTSTSSDTDAITLSVPAPCSSPSFHDMSPIGSSSSNMALNLGSSSDSAQDVINSIIDLTSSPKHSDGNVADDDMVVDKNEEPLPKEPNDDMLVDQNVEPILKEPVWIESGEGSSWCADCAKDAGTYTETLAQHNGSFRWIPCTKHKPPDTSSDEDSDPASSPPTSTSVFGSASSPSTSTSVSVAASSPSTSSSVSVAASSPSTSSSVSVATSSSSTSSSVSAASVSSSPDKVERLMKKLAAYEQKIQKMEESHKLELSERDMRHYLETFKPDFAFIPRIDPGPAKALYRAKESRMNVCHRSKDCFSLLADVDTRANMKDNGYLLHNAVLFMCHKCAKSLCPYHSICKHPVLNRNRPADRKIPPTFVHYPNSLWRLKIDYFDTLCNHKIELGLRESYSKRKAGLCLIFSKEAVEKWTADTKAVNLVKLSVAIRAYYAMIKNVNLDYQYMAGPDNGVAWGRVDRQGCRTTGTPHFSWDCLDWTCSHNTLNRVNLKRIISRKDASIKWYKHYLKREKLPAHGHVVEGAIYHLNAHLYKCPRRSLVCLTLYMIGTNLLCPSSAQSVPHELWMKVFSYLSAPWAPQSEFVAFHEKKSLWNKRVKNMCCFATLEANRLRPNWNYLPSVWPWEVGVTGLEIMKRVADALTGQHWSKEDRDPLIAYHILLHTSNLLAYEKYIDSIPDRKPCEHVYGLPTELMMSSHRP